MVGLRTSTGAARTHKSGKQKHGSLKMASPMPFGFPYNEAANPRAVAVAARALALLQR